MSDVYMFHRGPDVVRARITPGPMDAHRARLISQYRIRIGALLLASALFPPLAIFALSEHRSLQAKLRMLDHALMASAQVKASRQLDQMDSERWRAIRALGL